MAPRKKKAEEKPPPENVKVENFARNLPVALTREEVAERADRAAQLIEDRDHKEAELKAHNSHVKSLIATLEADMRHLSSEVRTKRTHRDVECERRYDYDSSVVREVRLDTGEVLSERPMSDREKQRDLPFDEEGGLDDDFAAE